MARKPTKCDGEFNGDKFFGAGPGNGWIHPIMDTEPVIIIPSSYVCPHDEAECNLARHCEECGSYRKRLGAVRFTKWKKPKILR